MEKTLSRFLRFLREPRWDENDQKMGAENVVYSRISSRSKLALPF